MKQYLLSVHHPDDFQPLEGAELQAMFDAVGAVNREMMEAGAWVFAGGLHLVDTATVVRSEGGETIVTDGPYVEAKEHIGGFWILRCDDLDEVLAWAAKAT